MKVKYLYGSFIVLLVTFIALISIKDETNLSIITSPMVYSFYQTSENETFHVSILTNKKDTYYFDQTYILDTTISGVEDAYLPIEITSISSSTESLEIEGEDYYEIVFECFVPFSMESEIISIKEAKLELSYEMDELISLDIGEFNYMFGNESNPFLTLGNLYITHELIGGIDTAGGVVLELGNLSNKEVTITSIDILSNSVSANQKHTKSLIDLPMADMKVSDILETSYDFNKVETKELSIDINQNHQNILYIPLSYTGDVKHIERFAVIIHYQDHNDLYQMIIDDFPFIHRSPFHAQYQETWITYHYD